MRVAMTYLRLPEAEGGGDPGAVARSIFGSDGWQSRYSVLPIAGNWQGLHYLLTGDPWEGPHPAADIVCGGRLLTEDGAEELGMDVIYLAPQRVKTAADHHDLAHPRDALELTTKLLVGVFGDVADRLVGRERERQYRR